MSFARRSAMPLRMIAIAVLCQTCALAGACGADEPGTSYAYREDGFCGGSTSSMATAVRIR